MKYSILFCCVLFVFSSVDAQFKPSKEGLTIIVSDGTDKGKNSQISKDKSIPSSYDYVGRKAPTSKNGIAFTDPIRELGMTDCIQAAAFLDRPKFGKIGFMLIFSINDSIGGRQAALTKNGKSYKGVYRLIRQKTSAKEPIPKGMTTYHIEGTFILLGIS